MTDKNIHRSDVVEALVNSGFMYLFMLIFSILGILFIFSTLIPFWLQFIIGMCFTVPIMMIYYYNGTKAGEREFKKLNGFNLDSVRKKGVVLPNIFKGFVYVAPYAIFTLLVTGICWLSDSQIFRLVLLVIFMPATVLGQSFGLITFPHLVTYNEGTTSETEYSVIEGGLTSGSMTFVVIMTFVLVACIVFWIAYMRKIRESKSKFSYFITEMVENDKLSK